MAKARISAADGWFDPEASFVAANGFDPLEWQRDYLKETINAVVLKGRQVGCSTAGASIAIRYARYWPNFLAAVVSPSQKQSTEVKLRAKQGLERIGESLVGDNAQEIVLANGSRILSLPGSAKSVRGWSAGLLILDEAAFIDADTFLAARATVAATGGRTIVQSTPAAPFGHFFDLYDQATDRADLYLPGTSTPDPTVTWVRYAVSSEDVTTISDEFLASERAKLSPEDYAQEYQGRFSSPGLGLVDPQRLKSMTQKAEDDLRTGPWAKIGGAGLIV